MVSLKLILFYTRKSYLACKRMKSMIKCLRNLNIVTFNNDYCKGGNIMAKETIQYQTLVNVVRRLSKEDKYCFFLSACEEADLKLCQICLDAGTDINYCECLHGRPVINELARRNKITTEMGDWLIEKGADINISGSDDRTNLSGACEKGNIKIAKYFIDKGIKIRHYENKYSKPNDLYLAVGSGNYELVRMLLELGSDFESDIKGYNYNPYIRAVKDKFSEIVELFLQKGASTNFEYYGVRPIHIAVENQDIQTASILLKYDANVNAKLNNASFSSVECGSKDFVITPMDIAVLKKDIAMQKLLISFGGTLSTKEDKIRALTECDDKEWAIKMIKKIMS